MKRLASMFALALALGAPASAGAAFGLHGLDVTFTGPDDSPSMQAGSHPFAMNSEVRVNTRTETVEGEELAFVDGALKDLVIKFPPGVAADPTAVPRCSTLDFLTRPGGTFEPPQCPDSTAVGVITVAVGEKGHSSEDDAEPTSIYNLSPPPGAVAKFGFWALDTPITALVGVTDEPPYRGVATVANAVQALEVFTSSLTVWGVPADEAHDALRGKCLRVGGKCPAGIAAKPFLTLPRSCTGPLETVFRATPWWTGGHLSPTPGGAAFEQTIQTHDNSVPPVPLGTVGCSKLPFAPKVSTQPTTDNASSPTGLDISLEVKDEGLTSPSGLAHSDIKKVVLALPRGVTANPSLAEGLATCSEAGLKGETLNSAPGEGCPQASKIGTLEAETPILEGKVLQGQLFIASQFENPFGSLLAFYMVIKDTELGVLVKQAGKIEPNPTTGQLISTIDDIPQFPLGQVRVRLREGGRSPLINPELCGIYTSEVFLTPWSNPATELRTTSSFEITRGVGGGPCPPAGAPPFQPGFEAGSINNQAGAYTPFYMRLTRRDGDQDLTRFSATLPKGLIARLAGTTQCPDASIAAAKAKSGRAELASPSCPASSQIGRLMTGAGVGSQLTYVPGSLYMAGRVGSAPLSVVAIVPAVAGPFDVGTVVVRQALQINPRTAEVRVDSSLSDPIPHILAGIPLKLRDAHVHVDRPSFTLNPTSCDPSAAVAQLWGGGLDPFSTADDAPVQRSVRFQAAGCASLGFKPRLDLRLKGGTRRGAFPALRTVYKPRPGDANLKELVLRLPRSAFLEQGHFRTICTRVQFAANACPPGAIYGKARAFTPLLDTPLEGPIYLRSSDHDLPDIVFDLHGLVDVEAVARVDSHKGGIRATVEDVPDAPVEKVVVTMQGGKKGLIVNSQNLCARKSRANVETTGQNAKRHELNPVVRAVSCKQGKSKKKR